MAKRLILVSLIFFSFCTPRQKIEVSSTDSESEQKIATAEALYQRAAYVPLSQAFQIYADLYSHPDLKKRIVQRFAMVSLLLAVRDKELGMDNRVFMERALELIQENPSLSRLNPYAEIAKLFWVQGKGVMCDIDERFSWKETEEKMKKMEGGLREKASADEFFAYMYLTLKCFFPSPFEERNELMEFSNAFPGSLLLKYKRATCPREDEALLKELLEEEPRFYEAAVDLGNLSLRRGDLLGAETYFLKAHQGIPDCPQTNIWLASIYLALEEVERSLEFYEKTLALAPEYRDAHLGKVICLSSLGKHAEAINVAEKIIALGYWLLGESYYWIAWNQHELKNNEEAEASIGQAKARLPTESKVFTLSGIIALERGALLRAENDFKEALQYNPENSDALFNLASVYAKWEDWMNSGVHFEKAGFAFEDEEQSLREKISRMEESALSPERKEKFLKKKRYQLEKALLSKATAFYNAAAGYYNAGQKSKALEMTSRAAEHPAFKEKAEELSSKIKLFP